MNMMYVFISSSVQENIISIYPFPIERKWCTYLSPRYGKKRMPCFKWKQTMYALIPLSNFTSNLVNSLSWKTNMATWRFLRVGVICARGDQWKQESREDRNLEENNRREAIILLLLELLFAAARWLFDVFSLGSLLCWKGFGCNNRRLKGKNDRSFKRVYCTDR